MANKGCGRGSSFSGCSRDGWTVGAFAALSSDGGVALGPAAGGEVREGVLLASEGPPSSSSTVTSESVVLNSAGTVEPVNKRASSSSIPRVSMRLATL